MCITLGADSSGITAEVRGSIEVRGGLLKVIMAAADYRVSWHSVLLAGRRLCATGSMLIRAET